MKTVRVSIVIVSWNALDIVRKCLPSVVATEFDGFEIIFADNASSDGSAEWVESHYPDVRVIRHPENWGFAKGNNEALKHAEGDLVVLLNNDVEVHPEWLTPLVRHLDQFPDVGAAQPKLLQYDHRESFEYSGAAGGFLDRWGYPFARGRLFDVLEVDEGQYDGVSDIFWASGTCMMVRRKSWNELGGLEESFFMHMEEIDLCWRLRRSGLRVSCVSESVVFHIGGASLPASNPRKTYLNFRNNLLMLHRNLPPAEWRRVLVVRVMLDLVAVLRFLLTLKLGDAWAILRAYASAHRMKGILQNNLPNYAPLPYRGSIVLDRFVRGVKRFSDLSKDRFLQP